VIILFGLIVNLIGDYSAAEIAESYNCIEQ